MGRGRRPCGHAVGGIVWRQCGPARVFTTALNQFGAQHSDDGCFIDHAGAADPASDARAIHLRRTDDPAVGTTFDLRCTDDPAVGTALNLRSTHGGGPANDADAAGDA